jgi:hypothetical protein
MAMEAMGLLLLCFTGEEAGLSQQRSQRTGTAQAHTWGRARAHTVATTVADRP